LLRASHIKPWWASRDDERLDKFNGLLLSPNFDALFDKGFITFKRNGDIQISSFLSNSAREKLGCSHGLKVLLLPEHEKYMAWHRETYF